MFFSLVTVLTIEETQGSTMRICKLFILFILLFGCGEKDPESGSVDVDRDGVLSSPNTQVIVENNDLVH